VGGWVGVRASAMTIHNADGLFYEHLEQTLQRTLYEDVVRGRWGCVEVGDTFFLISDKARGPWPLSAHMHTRAEADTHRERECVCV
jgi:hypothetical protein